MPVTRRPERLAGQELGFTSSPSSRSKAMLCFEPAGIRRDRRDEHAALHARIVDV